MSDESLLFIHSKRVLHINDILFGNQSFIILDAPRIGLHANRLIPHFSIVKRIADILPVRVQLIVSSGLLDHDRL